MKSPESNSDLIESCTLHFNYSLLLKTKLRDYSIFESMFLSRSCSISSILASSLEIQLDFRSLKVFCAIAILFKSYMSAFTGPIMWVSITSVFDFDFKSAVCWLTKSTN